MTSIATFKHVHFNEDEVDQPAESIDSSPEGDSFEGSVEVDSSSDVVVKETRVFKKAKRHHNGTNGHTSMNGFSNGGLALPNGELIGPSTDKLLHITPGKPQVPLGKNSKKSRTGRRGEPKKGGAGGKGTWGKPGSELGAELDIDDENDPNYDSDSNSGGVKLAPIMPELTKEQFETAANELIREYFEHGQVKDFMAQFADLDAKDSFRVRLPFLAISLAVQRKPLQCELTSQLLAELCGKAITDTDLTKGFDIVLGELPDVTLDAPDAPDLAGRFIARAVADDILPPKFVRNYKGALDSPEAVKALAKAENLMTMTHSYTRLDNVWGVSGGMKPTKLLVKKMKLLLDEFLSSDDCDEAQRCLKELDAPHFHHELVYQALLMVIEKSTGDVCSRISSLLASLCKSVILTVDQLTMGMQRIYRDMPEIYLDVPNAYALLERFVETAHTEKYLPVKVYRDMPQKGRKRFVSEGDGGRVKPAIPAHLD